MSGPGDQDGVEAIAPAESPEARLARECLHAVRYGYRNLGRLLAMVCLVVLIHFMCSFVLSPLLLMGGTGGGLLAAVVLGAIVVAAGGYFLMFWVDAAIAGMEGFEERPERPEFRFSAAFSLGIRGLGIYVVYVLPLVTLPLLPLGLLGLICTQDGRAYDVVWAARAAVRRPVQFLVLWGMLLLWTLALYAGVWGVLGLSGLLLARAVRTTGDVLTFLLFLPALVVAAAVGCMFATVIFHCIGIFGRYNEVVIEMLPEQPDRRRTLAFLGGGLVISALLVWAGAAMMSAGR